MLVTVFIVSILFTIAGGIFVQALDIQRRAFAIQDLEENGRFSLEVMAREIRFGEVQSADTNCPASPTTILSITHPINGNVEYSLQSGRIHRIVEGEDTVITASDVEVTSLSFCIDGVTEGDFKQPRVTISLALKAGEIDPQTLELQTTITQRLLND